MAALTVAVGTVVAPAAAAKKKKTKRATYTVSVTGQQNTSGSISGPCNEVGSEQVSFSTGPMVAKVTAKPGKDPRFVFPTDDGMDDGTPGFGATAGVYREGSRSESVGCSPPSGCGQTVTTIWGLAMFVTNDRIGIFGGDGYDPSVCETYGNSFPHFLPDSATVQPIDAALSAQQLMKAKQTLTASASGAETFTHPNGTTTRTTDISWTITLEPAKTNN